MMKSDANPINGSTPTKEQWFNCQDIATKLARWTPRILIAGAAGYYVLGYAYSEGWMAAIDQIAMKIMRYYEMGYIAIGALMPNVQWYAAWGVRITAAFVAGLAYDLMERVFIASIPFFAPEEPNKNERIKVMITG